jgi:predicted O-methyltransferase YrrM
MTTLDHVLAFFQVDQTGLDTRSRRMPIEIPNVGREDLAALFGSLGFKEGAEIGVETGLFAEVLCKANPDGHLLCVDAWRAYPSYRDHVTQALFDRFLAETQARLRPYHVTFMRDWSLEAAKAVPDGSLDYVYLDSNHDFQHISEDLCAWLPKVRTGGIAAGHDYVKRSNPLDGVHVAEVVTAYTQSYQIAPWFVLGSKEIKPGDVRDRPRSWFWVKS